jgi:MFS family permease
MHDEVPIWLKTVTTPGAVVFAIMFALESLARSTLWTIVPLQAFELLQHNARDVSILNFCVSISGLVGSFTIPMLIRRFRRRWVYSLGISLTILAAGLLATGTLFGQAGGMLARAFGGAASNIALSLYIMDYIRKRDLVHAEPLRLTLGAVAWAAGPFLGVFLNESISRGTGELVTIVSGLLLLGYFWRLRMQENPAVAAATRPPPSPIGSIGRFLAQPRLRLAWFIPFGRSCWWAMFSVYPPIYIAEVYADDRTFGHLMGALVVSAGNALLLASPLFGRLAARIGLRRPIIAAFIGNGLLTILAAVFFEIPVAVVATLLAAAVGAAVLDALGNIPFMRSVRPFERPQMTTVFRTYIDLSDLLPAAVFSFLLSYFDMRAVFVASGLFCLVVAVVARRLPQRM